MFPKTAVVNARKALERGYEGRVTVIEQRKVTKPNHTTSFCDVEVLEDQPCRLSFSSIPPAANGENFSTLSQTVKLFVPPDIKIKEGSKVRVTQNGTTRDYKASGVPAEYSTHNEINLELWKVRA